jgi:hypothetical protein
MDLEWMLDNEGDVNEPLTLFHDFNLVRYNALSNSDDMLAKSSVDAQSTNLFKLTPSDCRSRHGLGSGRSKIGALTTPLAAASEVMIMLHVANTVCQMLALTSFQT